MKILLKKENIKILLSAIIYFVLGVLFCAFLGKMLDVAETTICFVFLVGGAVLLLAYGLLPADGKVYQILIYGIICLGLGLLILMVRMFFMIALAALIAYGGIQSIMTAVKLRKTGKNWKGELIVGIVIVVLALTVIVLNGTNTLKNIVALFLGVTFLIEAAFEVIAIIKLLKAQKFLEANVENPVEAVEEQIAEAQEESN